MIPIAGSAYTYAYAILGEIFAWIIGWDLILEYAVSNMSVAVGFSAYLQDLGDNLFGIHLPEAIAYPHLSPRPASPAAFSTSRPLLITLRRHLGSGARREGKRRAPTPSMVADQNRRHPHLLHRRRETPFTSKTGSPFSPHGFSGILTGASIVFFTYIGFDSVSTAAEECKNPQRDLPIGIIATLIICTILYGSVALVLTGIAHYETLNNDSPVADALKGLGYQPPARRGHLRRPDGHDLVAARLPVRPGAGLVRDVARRPAAAPLLEGPSAASRPRTSAPGSRASSSASPPAFGTSTPSPNSRTSARCSPSSSSPPAVIVLRRKQPERPRSFRVPLVPLVPLLSIGCCLLLMMGLPLLTWIRFFVWLVIGLAIYAVFGRKNSTIQDA